MFLIVQRYAALVAMLPVFLLSPSLRAQTVVLEEPGYVPTLTFDIVSIRMAPMPTSANFHVSVSSPPHSSRFDATNFPLKTLVQVAYGQEMPVANAPEWMSNTFWNIQCRSDDAADAKLAKLTDNEVRLEKRHAIQVLLAERMGLKTHMETRNTAIYNLVVAKGGVKMKLLPPPPPLANGETQAPPPPTDVQTHGSQHGLEFVAPNANMRTIVGVLSSMLQMPVVDKTGLTGTYAYTLQFGQEWSAHDPDSWPSIFTAVQEQMGLKLEAVHEAVPNLVIDNVTKPTEN